MKKITLISLMLGTVVLLASCGTDTDTANETAQKTSTGQQKVETKTSTGTPVVEKKACKVEECDLNANVVKFLKGKGLNDVKVGSGLYTVENKSYDALLAFKNYPGRVSSSIEDESGTILIFNKDFKIVDSVSKSSRDVMMNYVLFNQIIAVTESDYTNLKDLALKRGIFVPETDAWKKFVIENKIEEICQAIKTQPDTKKKYLEYVQKKIREIQEQLQKEKTSTVGQNVLEVIK